MTDDQVGPASGGKATPNDRSDAVRPGTPSLPADQENVPILEDQPGDPEATPDRAQTDLDTGTGPD
jgi:hypothetical protein